MSLWISTQYDAHGGCAACTIATMPTLTTTGRLSHTRITVARSSGMCDTHRTHFSCKHVSFGCSDMSSWCWSTGGEAPPSVSMCWGFVVNVSFSCDVGRVEAAGIEPASESLQLQRLHAFPGKEISHPSSLPSRARTMLAWFEFRATPPPGGGAVRLAHIVTP